jgi:protein-S-isoprenylcysteine O-methyltransferase Ste14
MPSSSTSGRGGTWVVAQFALMAVILSFGAVPPIWPDWVRALGIAGMLAGAALGVWAGRTLGTSLTPFPRPRAEGVLIESGPYAIVRHPIYAAGTLFFLGYGLLASIPATVATIALAILWHFKARVEERHLAQRFPGYEDYRRRVRWQILPYVV